MFAITRIATVMSAFVASTLAQSSTITTSLLFGDSMSADQYAWGGSVVAAQSDRTTFAVNCVSNCGPLQGYTVSSSLLFPDHSHALSTNLAYIQKC